MSYDPARATLRDEIRFQATDTNPAAEICTDAEYDASIARHANPLRATAEMIDAVADRIDQLRTSTTVPGDFAATWSAQRTAGLRAKAARYRAEADAEEAAATIGRDVVLVMDYLTDDPDAPPEWT